MQNLTPDERGVDALSGKRHQRVSLGGDSAKTSTTRIYWLLAATEFRRFSTYRLAILAGVVTQSVFGFIRGRTVHAVDGISASIMSGEAVGYIGANGAGKSTTIKMLTGILVPTGGQVRTCGYNPVPQRRLLAREIGVVWAAQPAVVGPPTAGLLSHPGRDPSNAESRRRNQNRGAG